MQDEASILYEQGLAFAAAGQLPEAREALKGVYQLDSTRTDAISALARLERDQGELDEARDLLARALPIHPQDPGIHFELGCLFHETGQLEFALNYYRDALKLKPDLADAWHQLGRLFQQLERYPQAQEAYEQALEIDPQASRYWNSLGLLHYFGNQADLARPALAKAVEYKPERAAYYLNLGMAWLLEDVDLEQAIQSFEMALRLHPEFSREMIALGDHFMHRGQPYMARPFYRCALVGKVDRFDLYVKLAQCAERECDMQMALDYYRQALDIKPDQWLLQVRAALLLPMVYQTPEEVMEWRARFVQNLEHLHEMVKREKLPRSIQTLSMYSPAFLLAYQGIDNKRLLERMSQLWRKLFALPATARVNPREHKRKFGIVSAFFFDHSIAGDYLELVRELLRRGHEVYTFALGMRKVDHVTMELQASTHWQVLPVDQQLPRLADKIISADLDVLLFPEIGLDPLTYFLAHGRLAPLQVQLFGHPSTSGVETVDYFVTDAHCELENAQEHYTETLVQMPRSPFYFSKPRYPAQVLSRAELGLPPELQSANLYLVPGTLFKIHPNHDALFARILQKDEKARIVMIQPSTHQWQDKLWMRFERTLKPWLDRIHFVPWMDQERFYSLLIQADAVLDTLHFTAGNVAYQAFGLGVPMITLPGSFLRSRTTYGLYKQMDFLDLVANTPEEFTDLALRLARDKDWQSRMREQVKTLSEPLFDDKAIMIELADTLLRLPPR